MKKKSRVQESVLEEAERLDDLEERGDLDDLPFTRLRRYAKEPSQVYAIRIPVSRLEAIRRLAEIREEQPTALLREWVLERLDEELAETQPRLVKEAPSRYGARAGSKKSRPRPKRAAMKPAAKTRHSRAAASKKK